MQHLQRRQRLVETRCRPLGRARVVAVVPVLRVDMASQPLRSLLTALSSIGVPVRDVLPLRTRLTSLQSLLLDEPHCPAPLKVPSAVLSTLIPRAPVGDQVDHIDDRLGRDVYSLNQAEQDLHAPCRAPLLNLHRANDAMSAAQPRVGGASVVSPGRPSTTLRRETAPLAQGFLEALWIS